MRQYRNPFDRHDAKKLVVKLPELLLPTAPDGFWLAIPLEPGKVFEVGVRAGGMDITRALFAHELVKKLNAEIGNDGVWCVGFTDWPLQARIIIPGVNDQPGPRRLLMPWFDRDMDLIGVVDAEDHLGTMVLSHDDYVEQCSEALKRWGRWFRDMDIKQGRDTIAATLGQKSADDTAINPVVPFD